MTNDEVHSVFRPPQKSASQAMTQQAVNQSRWTDEQIGTAKRIWTEYETTHDVSDRKGQTAGIDPESGAIWFGTDIFEIVDQRKKQGLNTPLFFVRIGYPTYLRKKYQTIALNMA